MTELRQVCARAALYADRLGDCQDAGGRIELLAALEAAVAGIRARPEFQPAAAAPTLRLTIGDDEYWPADRDVS